MTKDEIIDKWKKEAREYIKTSEDKSLHERQRRTAITKYFRLLLCLEEIKKLNIEKNAQDKVCAIGKFKDEECLIKHNNSCDGCQNLITNRR